MWLVKTDADGNAQWNRTYGGEGWDDCFSLLATSDGGYALAGDTASFGSGMWDMWFVKTDADGNAQWNRTYGGSSNDIAHSMVRTSYDGGYAIAGETHSYGAGEYDMWLVKTYVTGAVQWNHTYGGADNWDKANSILWTSDGGYALAGETLSYGAGGIDIWLVKTDVWGNVQWNRTYGGKENEVANTIVETPDGGFALGGYTDSYGAGSDDGWLVRVASTSPPSSTSQTTTMTSSTSSTSSPSTPPSSRTTSGFETTCCVTTLAGLLAFAAVILRRRGVSPRTCPRPRF
jgi:hypothetical protein